MKTRRREPDVPSPGSPWNEITPGLWMGGHEWTDVDGELHFAVADTQFDLVLSLFVRAGHGPPPGAEHVIAEMPDGPLTADQIAQVRRLAVLAAGAVRAGRTTLVRCQAGYNRSGLVVVQALVELGYGTAEAIEMVRRRRSPWALHNELFVKYLESGLEVAQLLSGLDA